jgi:hypothetical protein
MKELLTILLLLGSVSWAAGQDQPDSTFGPEGEERIVELTKWLEENPLAENRKEVWSVGSQATSATMSPRN